MSDTGPPALAIALPNAYFDSLGIPRLTVGRSLNPPNRRMRTRMYGGVRESWRQHTYVD